MTQSYITVHLIQGISTSKVYYMVHILITSITYGKDVLSIMNSLYVFCTEPA